MVIANMDQMVNSMGNNSTRLIIDKTSIGNTAAGNYTSLWRALGYPGQGAIPTTPEVTSDETLGAFGFAQQTPPATSYFGHFEAVGAFAGMTIEIHDRIMHRGGLVGNIITSQTVGVDVHANLATQNVTARIGDPNYSDLQWWLEWYTDTGSTASNATINVTYNDDSSGNLTVQAVGGTVRAGRMIPLNSLIPSASSGKYIRDVNTIQLSASTGTAGNFGVTVTRYRGSIFLPTANGRFTATWADLGLPEIPNDSCLFPIVIANGTSTGVVRATGKIIHG